ncbi:MAG: EamA family transporter RarD, partial [Pseudomonadota bacterium]
MTRTTDSGTHEADVRQGVLAATTAYTLWGVLPLYLLLANFMAAEEMLAHRILWSVPFGALIITWRRQWPDVGATLVSMRRLRWLALAAAAISINWLLYIVAVYSGNIFQASLGYYINPLIYMVVGMVFFSDRLGPLQIAAVVLAGLGVVVLTVSGGEFPYIALTLGVTFTVYGVIRKQVAIGAMPGLFIETVLLAPLAVAGLSWLVLSGSAVFTAADTSTAQYVILFLAGPVTVVPLLLFAIGARRLTLSTVGFLQVIGPTLQFIIGWLNGEPLSPPRIVCFVLI